MSQLKWWKTACAVCALSAATAIALPAQTFKNLVYFNGTDGSNSGYGYAGLVQGTDGYLYGTTPEGGANYGCSAAGCGTVFRITPTGVLTTLYSFCSQSGCTDGGEPFAGMVEGADGNFYGTTAGGGTGCSSGGCGTIFKITRQGQLTTLHSFDGTDGDNPWGSLTLAGDGNFYGVTALGGTIGYGTVFKVTPAGTLTTLYSFCVQSNCTDGAIPQAGLVASTDGNLYGTTAQGGIMSCLRARGELGCGTVFKITPSGALTTLHRFGITDGAAPFAALVEGPDGNYYGTTEVGGNKGCDYGANTCGTVFRITPGGALTTLYKFCSQTNCTDGYSPLAGLVLGTDGNLYGTTAGGGTDDYGTVFEMNTTGTLTTLYSLSESQIHTPAAQLAQDTNGSFYGTTVYGGNQSCYQGCGGIFALSVGLGRFVETQPALGTAGSAVRILGSSLTGATSVTFNGTAATFTVESSSLIRTTVPAGATTGTVQVVTPGGTLSSNVPFRVLP